MKTEMLRIGSADVILQDYEPGKGKIIISDDNSGYNFSYYWGAMGSPFKDFLKSINTGYFVHKLGPIDRGPICMRKTMKAVRKFLRDESGLPWYKFMDEQKELREKLSEIEKECGSADGFINSMYDLKYLISYCTYKKTEFDYAVDMLMSEPWHFIEHGEHPQNKWLADFHKKLKASIN